MRKFFYHSVFLGFTFILLTGTRPVFSQGFSPETRNNLMQVLQHFQNDPAHPFVGGITASIKVDDLAEWQGATGFASRNIDASNNLLPGGIPFTTATLSRTYSVTKTFTAALVLELAKAGVFSLDNPVSNFIPLSLINPDLNSSVTIRQLLAHESGYSDFLENINLQIAVAAQPTRVWSPFEVLTFAQQVNVPGATRKYSSTNYIILGSIVEAATHKPIEQHFRERFFNPLHLNSMYLAGREPIGIHGTLADPHDNISALNPVFQATGQPTFPDAFTNIRVFPFIAIESISFTSGGIVSNARDLAEWGSALFGARATSVQTRNQMVNSISNTPDEDGDFLGYGIWRTTKISSTDVFLGHDGNATGYRSVMFYQPDRKLTLVVLTNFHGANLYDIAKALYEALPDFTCGNHNENKIVVCKNGNTQCIPRAAASNLIHKGATLGPCYRRHNDRGDEENEDDDHSGEGHHSNGHDEMSAKKVGEENVTGNISLTAFPNPFSNEAMISVKNSRGRIQIDLVNANGQVVNNIFNGVMEGERTFKVSTSKLPSGLYTIRLRTTETIISQKILKK